MNIIADSGNNSLSLDNPDLSRDSSRYFAQAKESTLAFLQCGRSFDLERQRLQEEQGDRQGTRLFKELIASLGWWYTSALEAIDLSRRYWALSDELRSLLDAQPQWWSIEGLKKLLKLSVGQIQKALAQAVTQMGNSLSRFLKPFTAKKYLKPGEIVTEDNWPAMAELIAKKLGLEEGQLEEMKVQAIALAGEEPLTGAHLIQAVEALGYAVDGLLPPAKRKTYTPTDIAAIEQKAKEEALAQFQQQLTEQLLRVEREAAQKQQESDRRIQQLEQQLQTLIQRSPHQQADSTIGAQAIATLLKTGESHPAASVPSSGQSKTRQPDWMRLNAQPPVNAPYPELVKPPKSPRLGNR